MYLRGLEERKGGTVHTEPNRERTIRYIRLNKIPSRFLSKSAFGLSIEPGAAVEHSFQHRIPYALIDAFSPTR